MRVMDEYTFNTWVLAWIGVAFIAFIGSRMITAPYGRHASRKWGVSIPNRWGWVLMEIPALALTPFIYIYIGNYNLVATIMVLLWVVHYVHRTLIFPFQLNTKGKTMPLAIAVMAVFFNAGNGFFNGYWFGHYANYGSEYLYSARFIIGVSLFVIGMLINLQSDYKLINLRKPGESGYKIPTGGMFKYISCPNHFGEIIEWLGFAIAAASLPAWSFFVWSAANLIPRALSHHKWYQKTFVDYPKKRKAVFPGIF